MSALYEIRVQGEPKGDVFKHSGRWRWQRDGRGTETYHRRARLLTVREHVARLCRVTIADVRLVKKPWTTTDLSHPGRSHP